MPVTLPPLSRRKFLAGTLAAGASWLLGRPSLGAEQADPNRWILLADTHIWAERDKEHRGVKPAVNFAVVRQAILRLPYKPAGVVIAGDLAYMDGRPGDYAALIEELEPLRQAGLTVHLVLGNHDHRENFFAAFKELKEQSPVAERHAAVIETPPANLFLLDSLLRTNFTPGQCGQAQLKWLAEALDKRSDKPAIVVAHHYPEKVVKSGLLDIKELYEVLLPRKQVKAFIFGHSHAWQVSEHEGIQLINVPATAWVFSTAVAAGWVEATLSADRISLVRRCLDPTNPKDGEKAELKWRT
jgi:predicted phosphodiesterase